MFLFSFGSVYWHQTDEKLVSRNCHKHERSNPWPRCPLPRCRQPATSQQKSLDSIDTMAQYGPNTGMIATQSEGLRDGALLNDLQNDSAT